MALGIDMSSYSIEVMALTSGRDVAAYERVLLEEGIIRNGIVQKKDMLQVALDRVLAKLHARIGSLGGIRAVVNIPDQQTYTHYFDVPINLTGKGLTAYLQKEAETVIPLEVGDMTATYVAAESSQPSKITKRILFIGTKKEVTQGILEVLRAVGVDAPVLDLESLALMRSLIPERSADTVLVLDGGSEASAMHIFEGHSLPILSVACPAGGRQATERIAEKMGLSFEEAEKIKCVFSLLKAPRVVTEADDSPPSLPEGENPKDIAKEVSVILHDWYQLVIADARKAIAFYEMTYHKRVAGIILSGGSAMLPGVVSYLTAWIERPVRLGNPLAHLHSAEVLGKDKPSLMYTTVVGLALRGIDPLAVGVDFTHGAVTGAKKFFPRVLRSWIPIMLTISAVILFILLVYALLLFLGNDGLIRYERTSA